MHLLAGDHRTIRMSHPVLSVTRYNNKTASKKGFFQLFMIQHEFGGMGVALSLSAGSFSQNVRLRTSEVF